MSEVETTEVSKKRWYVLQAFSGFENRVAVTLREYIKLHKMEDQFGEVLVPTEEIIENVGGKRRKTERKFFPGYVLVEMIMSDQAWYVVRNTPGVTGFVGSHGAGSKPSPLLPEEVDTLLGRLGVPTHAPVDLHAKVGDYVIITEGAFDGMSGKVTEIDDEKQKVKVTIEMFGRETVAELEFYQVKEDDSY